MFCVGVAIISCTLYAQGWRLPDRWNPFAPLDVEEPPAWLTRYKLARLSKDAALCQSTLGRTALQYQRVADRRTAEGCGFQNAVLLRRTSAQIGEAVTLTCRSAVSLALWEKHVVQPAALEHYGRPVMRIEHFGSYACRNIYGRESARRSNHATADALDVAGFVISGGHRVQVASDWPDGDTDAAFLHDVHRGACLFFDGVLGPDYNEAHRDHFHLDRGPYRVCR